MQTREREKRKRVDGWMGDRVDLHILITSDVKNLQSNESPVEVRGVEVESAAERRRAPWQSEPIHVYCIDFHSWRNSWN
jgi:hypothetical protein